LKKKGQKKKKKKNQKIAVNPRESGQGLVNPGQSAGRVWSILGRAQAGFGRSWAG